MNIDWTEVGAYIDGPSVEEVSVSESVSEEDAAFPTVSEASAGAPGCPVDQVD